MLSYNPHLEGSVGVVHKVWGTPEDPGEHVHLQHFLLDFLPKDNLKHGQGNGSRWVGKGVLGGMGWLLVFLTSLVGCWSFWGNLEVSKCSLG